jgi:hypothetical protein
VSGTLRVQVRQQLGQGIRKNGWLGGDRAELAGQVQVAGDGPVPDALAWWISQRRSQNAAWR